MGLDITTKKTDGEAAFLSLLIFSQISQTTTSKETQKSHVQNNSYPDPHFVFRTKKEIPLVIMGLCFGPHYRYGFLRWGPYLRSFLRKQQQVFDQEEKTRNNVSMTIRRMAHNYNHTESNFPCLLMTSVYVCGDGGGGSDNEISIQRGLIEDIYSLSTSRVCVLPLSLYPVLSVSLSHFVELFSNHICI